MKKILEIESMRNDLFAEFECECPREEFKDDPDLAKLFKTKIRLTGYNDSYFFDEVNKEPRVRECKCGRKYNIQWTRKGVEVELIK